MSRVVITPQTFAGAITQRLADDAARLRRQDRRTIPTQEVWVPFVNTPAADYGLVIEDKVLFDHHTPLSLADGTDVTGDFLLRFYVAGVEVFEPFTVAATPGSPVTVMVSLQDPTLTGNAPSFTLKGYDLDPSQNEEPTSEEDTD